MGNVKVPLVDLGLQYKAVEDETNSTVLRVLSSGSFILGPEVESFEREMAEYVGTELAVGVECGTDAMFLIMRALGIGPGDEVITTHFTYIATADSISNCGGVPVFTDIDPRTFNLSPQAVLDAVTPRTRATIAVHLYGQPADMDSLVRIAESRNIYFVEDCAQTAGAEFRGRRVGSFGVASAFSFFPTKNLGGAGDGGMVCTSDEAVAEKVGVLRIHGESKKYMSESLGVNSRLDEIQAAILRVKLRQLDRWNEERREIASFYDGHLHGVETPYTPEGARHVYHQYTIRTDRRESLIQALEGAGIGCRIYYPVPLHEQPCFKALGYGPGDFPQTERACEEVLSLPMFPGMTREQTQFVCDAVNRWSVAG